MDLEAAFAASSATAALTRVRERRDELEAASSELASAKRRTYVQRGGVLFLCDRASLAAEVAAELSATRAKEKKLLAAAVAARGAEVAGMVASGGAGRAR
uniref:Prefoldin subunit 1 n=1 Tax=Bicosoecida sp. CB-2014 TaxID=1486930 RepID=A0A7S1C3Z8_9STRA|mmetsp:Transcript_11183/g.38908  ORF Transcript_11183/g.38908 Transcript_11183/m.38908 type:complete len:100 (+) Transcript_11183:102-401(+)